MSAQPTGIEWEAYEHHHVQKGSDWFWVLGILTIAVTITAILLHNTLLGILLLLSGAIMSVLSLREPKIISHAVTLRGLRIDDKLYPFTTLESYFIDDRSENGPQLLIRSQKIFMPLIIMPLPEEYVEEIEDIIAERIPEEHLEEPVVNKLLEFFGF